MNLDTHVSLPDDVAVNISRKGSIRVWRATVGDFVHLAPAPVYLLLLLSRGGTVRAAVERALVLDEKHVGELLDVLVENALVTTDALNVASPCPVPDDMGDSEAPIFVLGFHRSGTTLVRWILDAHPRICCASDTLFLQAVKQTFWGPQRYQLQNLNRLGVSDELVKKHMVEFARSMFEVVLRKNGKVRYADKTNAYAQHADFLAWLFDGRCRFVVVVRHGLDAASSDYFQGAAWPDASDGPSASEAGGTSGLPLEARLRRWADVNSYLHRFVLRNPQVCYCLRYEDLVRDPERVTEAMLGFLGEAMPRDLLTRTFSDKQDLGGGAPVFEDHKIRHTRRIETDRVERFRQWPSALVASVGELVNPTLRLWGYDEVR